MFLNLALLFISNIKWYLFLLDRERAISIEAAIIPYGNTTKLIINTIIFVIMLKSIELESLNKVNKNFHN